MEREMRYEHQPPGLGARLGGAALAHRLSFSSFFRFVILV